MTHVDNEIIDDENDLTDISFEDIDEFCHDWEGRDSHVEIYDQIGINEPKIQSTNKIQPPGHHYVRQGETLASIALTYGFSKWENIWYDKKNSKIREKNDPASISPGLRIYIPGITVKEESHESNYKYRFRKKTPKVWLRLIFRDQDGLVRTGMKYELILENQLKTFNGETDENGRIEILIPADTSKCFLKLIDKSNVEIDEKINLFVNSLDSLDSLSGILARLSNLGYYCGVIEGDFDTEVESAIRFFQEDQKGLTATGQLDYKTKQALFKIHDLDIS